MLNKTKTKDLLPLERFWYEQNQKLIANEGFLDDLGNVFNDKFFFKNRNGKTELDFTVFDLEHIRIKQPAILTLSGKQYQITLKEYAKLLVINSITPRSVSTALPVYTMMKHLAAFLNIENEKLLSPENIELFHVSFLTQSVTDTRWMTRLAPPSYRATYNNFKFQSVQRTLYSLGVEGIIDARLTNRHINKTLDNVCRSIMALSRIEFMQGSSFNTLTLDIGQYYVDHLKQIYEKDYLYTLVCQSAIKSV